MQVEEVSKFPQSDIRSLDPIPLLPNIEVHILSSKYDAPIKAIAFMDTGEQKTLMNSAILLSSAWEPGAHFFKAADGKIFRADLITKHKIGIKFFLDILSGPKLLGQICPTKILLLV